MVFHKAVVDFMLVERAESNTVGSESTSSKHSRVVCLSGSIPSSLFKVQQTDLQQTN